MQKSLPTPNRNNNPVTPISVPHVSEPGQHNINDYNEYHPIDHESPQTLPLVHQPGKDSCVLFIFFIVDKVSIRLIGRIADIPPQNSVSDRAGALCVWCLCGQQHRC